MNTTLKLTPSFKDYIWGGEKLMHRYGVQGMERVAEAWVLSAHPDGPSYLPDGTPFTQALEAMGRQAWGSRCRNFEDFPQLIKFIDAKKDLSIQVHPNDEYALKNEGQFGKTEMWYILDADEGAGIYYGFQKEVSKETFAQSIRDNTLTDLLNFVPVKKGECYFIPSGTIHAIGKGLLIAEIQQNSNVTYRVYDYNRKDAQGNTRPLHVDKALAVTTTAPVQVDFVGERKELPDGTVTQLAQCPYFAVDRVLVKGNLSVESPDSFTAVLVTVGSGTVNGQPAKEFDTFFVAAGTPVVLDGDMEVLVSRV